MRNDKQNVIVEKAINFSVAINKYCEALDQRTCIFKFSNFQIFKLTH